MKNAVCRWGILGAAEIARKNWLAIHNAPNCTLAAVASRNIDRCRRFIEECSRHAPIAPAPRAYDSYEQLLASPDVDAVYIPLPTGVRKSWAIRAAEAGKHVLIEKPAGLCAEDVREIIAACRRNNVQFMDGVMFVHSRRMDAIRTVLDDGRTVGAIKRITAQFSDGEAASEAFAGNIRADARLEPFGALGDLGWYCIRFILWALNWQLPAKVAGHVLAEYRSSPDSAAVPTDFSAELFFADGVSAGLYNSFSAQIHQWVNVAGTLGSLHVSDFVLPRNGDVLTFETSNPSFAISGCNFVMEDKTRQITVAEHSHGTENAQETNMFRRFAELALSGRPDPFWADAALKTQQVVDACLRSARSGGCPVELTR